MFIVDTLFLSSLIAYAYYPQSLRLVTGLLTIVALFSCFHAHTQWNNKRVAKPSATTKQITVANILQRQNNYLSFVGESNNKDKYIIHWYNPIKSVATGQVWRLTLHIKPLHVSHNPTPNMQMSWFKTHNIIGKANIVNNKHTQPPVLIHPNKKPKLRAQLQRTIKKNIHDSLTQMTTLALLTGDRSAITPNMWAILQNTGTNHMIAVAGLHLGLIAWLCYKLGFFLFAFFPKTSMRFPAPWGAMLCAWLGALTYSHLTGFAIPTQRAFIALTIISIHRWHVCRSSRVTLFILTLFSTVICMPLDIYSSSFALSFTAMAAILWAIHTLPKQKVLHLPWIQWCLFWAILPLCILYYHQITWLGLFVNLLIVPWLSLVLMPLQCLLLLGLSISPLLSKPIIMINQWSIHGTWWFLQLCNRAHFINTIVVPYHTSWLISLIPLCVLMINPLLWKRYYLALVIALPVAWPAVPPVNLGHVTMIMFDVGQGLSIMLRTQHHSLIYDAGPAYPGGFDSGKEIVEPAWRRLNLSKPPALVISHGDNDHIGGAFSLVHDLSIHSILTSVPQRFRHATACYAGQHWQWDGVSFRILWPPYKQSYRDNNSSCVLQVISKHHRILLTGDIEKPAELQMVLSLKAQLRSDILQVPHHGSCTSSSWPFLHAVNPQQAWISRGTLNRFHLPCPAVLARYRALHIRLKDTADHGFYSSELN